MCGTERRMLVCGSIYLCVGIEVGAAARVAAVWDSSPRIVSERQCSDSSSSPVPQVSDEVSQIVGGREVAPQPNSSRAKRTRLSVPTRGRKNESAIVPLGSQRLKQRRNELVGTAVKPFLFATVSL